VGGGFLATSRRLAQERWPLWCGFLALPVFALFILVATLVSPGYSHATDTISHLGGQGSPHPWIASTGILIYGLMVLAFTFGLYQHFGESTEGKIFSTLLAINALTILFTVFLGKVWGEVPLEAPMLGDSLHEAASRTGFTSLTLAMLLFPALVWRHPPWRRVRWTLVVLTILAVSFGIAFAIGAFPDRSGVLQRLFFGACGVWAQVVALQTLRTG
jgi:hypothetical protein